jgi:hypothetical protein
LGFFIAWMNHETDTLAREGHFLIPEVVHELQSRSFQLGDALPTDLSA